MKLIHVLFYNFLALVSLFFMGRLALFLIYFDRFSQSGVNYWLSFVYGLKMDIIVACIILIFPLILLTLFPKKLTIQLSRLIKTYFLIAFLFFIYIESATFPFFAEYDVRPNFLFVEYLNYPGEVFGMLFSQYKLELAATVLLMTLFAYGYNKTVNIQMYSAVFELNYAYRVMLLAPLILILAIGIRSSFGHRPANLSDAMYSSNRLVNEITKNSFYSIAYAIYTNKKFAGKSLDQYGKMELTEALQRVRGQLNIYSDNKESPFSRLEKSHFPQAKPKNLVVFIQESLGAQFVEVTGGAEGLTPNFNRLSQDGLLFTNHFSNGTRSIRGIAGLVSGNFSVPGKGVIKRNKSQSEFFTLASLLKPYGYHSLFIYGGESRFDNMKSWFSGNGFNEIIDEAVIKKPEYVGTWGVSDEDLVNAAHNRFKSLHSKNQPFAAVMFSTSNHSPFDYPAGKIKLVEGVEEKSELNTIKYADYAIGQFIKQARNEAYYKDTIFVIAADHNIRVRGSDMLPVNMYHIPAMILGDGVEAQIVSQLTSQPDVLATALDLIGIDLNFPILGRSIFSDQKKDISLMQFNDTYAYRVGDKVSVLRPNKEALTFRYENKKMLATEHDKELELNTLAFIMTLNYLYQELKYR